MLHDLRIAIRRLWNAPMFTLMAVGTLALAIGANTAIFSVADAVVLRPLPYSDPARVCVVTMVNRRTGERSWSVPYEYVRAIDNHHGGVGSVGLRGPTMMTIHAGGAEAEWMETLAVAPDYLRVLGVQPVRGRLFDERDAADPGRAALLTYETWQRRFGGDETILGRSVRLGTEARDVVGVLPAGFLFPSTSLQFLYGPTGRPAYVTVALPPAPGADPRARNAIVMGGFAANPIVRLEAGVTRERAQAELDALVEPIRASRPDGRDERIVLDDPRSVLFPVGRPIMSLLVAAAGLVLLIGCTNLANMLLVRTRRREREIGLHAALGATRLRIVRPIVFESLIVGTLAAVAAFAATAVTFDVLLRQVPPIAYGSAFVNLNVRVAIFALALGLIGGVAFAATPAWQSARLDVRVLLDSRRSSRRRPGAFAHPIIAAQVALAIILVFGAVIAARAFVSVLRIPLGFSPDNLVAINVRPERQEGGLRAFYARASDTLGRRADVLSAGAAGSIPMDGFQSVESVQTSEGQQPAGILYVLPGYFETVGVTLVRGRLLTSADVDGGADVAVVSQAAARALFADRDPIGASLRGVRGRTFTVVGMVSDVQRSLSRRLEPPVYVIPPEDSTRGMTLVARARSRGPHTLAEIRREIGALAPGTPVTAVWWSESVAALTAYRNPRFQTIVLGTFAALALGLTALGTFAAVAFAVAARTREMGVRLALGAPPRSLVRLIVRQALVPVAVGTLGGVAATPLLRRVAEAQLFDVRTSDPGTLAAAALTVAAAAFVAAYVPARHASRVDPIVVLRAE